MVSWTCPRFRESYKPQHGCSASLHLSDGKFWRIQSSSVSLDPLPPFSADEAFIGRPRGQRAHLGGRRRLHSRETSRLGLAMRSLGFVCYLSAELPSRDGLESAPFRCRQNSITQPRESARLGPDPQFCTPLTEGLKRVRNIRLGS